MLHGLQKGECLSMMASPLKQLERWASLPWRGTDEFRKDKKLCVVKINPSGRVFFSCPDMLRLLETANVLKDPPSLCYIAAFLSFTRKQFMPADAIRAIKALSSRCFVLNGGITRLVFLFFDEGLCPTLSKASSFADNVSSPAGTTLGPTHRTVA